MCDQRQFEGFNLKILRENDLGKSSQCSTFVASFQTSDIQKDFFVYARYTEIIVEILKRK
jgi:hypothetical protein